MDRKINVFTLVTRRGELYAMNTEFSLENFSLIIQSSPNRTVFIGRDRIDDIVKVIDEETGEYKYTVTNLH